MQRIQAAEREDVRRRKQSERQDSKKVDLFAKVVLRREAQALKKAASFAEFKRILLRANMKSSTSKRSTILSENGVDSSEANGGVVFHLSTTPRTEASLVSQRVNEEGKRSISKRSLDEVELSKGEEMKDVRTSSQRKEYLLPKGNVTEDAFTEDETENRESYKMGLLQKVAELLTNQRLIDRLRNRHGCGSVIKSALLMQIQLLLVSKGSSCLDNGNHKRMNRVI